jgi:CRISPR type III-A-associated RAMP protein Csm5
MESIKIRLETLTPVRIGSHIGQITPYDYVLSGGNCYVISDERLSAFLGRNNLIDRFSESIARKGKNFDIGQFLSEHDMVDEQGLRRLSSYVVQVHENARPMRLLTIIRDTAWKPYIPGSSIKGAMRTAVIYANLKRMKASEPDRFDRSFIRPVKSKIETLKGKSGRISEWDRKRFAGDIEKELTNHFNLEDFTKRKGSNISYIHDPHTDIFRCLKVSDALPVKPLHRIYDFRVLDKQANGDLAFESPIFAEALSPGAVFEFQVSWDSWLADRFKTLNDIPINGLDDVLKACKTFAEDQVAWESRFFEGCSKGAEDPGKVISSLTGMEPDLRLGWGSGLTGASLSMLLPMELKLELRDLFYRRHSSGVREFPKSRRVLVEKNTPVSLLGFCSLKRQDQ